jgi:hypothetical protein
VPTGMVETIGETIGRLPGKSLPEPWEMDLMAETLRKYVHGFLPFRRWPIFLVLARWAEFPRFVQRVSHGNVPVLAVQFREELSLDTQIDFSVFLRS